MAALQHGIATVGTDGHHTDDLLRRENGKAFLLTGVLEPTQFVEAVLRLVADVEMRQNFGDEARQLYEARFDWEVVAGSLETFLMRPVGAYSAGYR